MAFAIAAGRHPKFPTHQPITKSMYFLPRESVRMLPFVAATCSSAGSSLARTRGSRRRAGMKDPFCAQLGRRPHYRDQHILVMRIPTRFVTSHAQRPPNGAKEVGTAFKYLP